MNLKIKCNQDLIELLSIYRKFNYEVGGMLFGNIFFNKYIIKSASFKKGKKTEISFSEEDKKIYIFPHKQKLIGTWHLHPMQDEAIPSARDLYQWKIWKKYCIHIICSKNDFKIFNNKGVCIYEHLF